MGRMDTIEEKPTAENAAAARRDETPQDTAQQAAEQGAPNRLLLHACCGPCSMEPVRTLQERGIDLSIFYANSNIHPQDEYVHRLETLHAWSGGEIGDPSLASPVEVIEGHYNAEEWEWTAGCIGDAAIKEARELAAESAAAQEALAGGATPEAAITLAVDPDRREARCRACYRLRFEEAAAYAAENGYDALGTTLSVSPYQYTDVIREELERAAAEAGIRPYFEDYRPHYDEATRRSRALGMYRQNFCGCRISDLEAQAERAQRKAQRAAAKAEAAKANAAERATQDQAAAARKAERAAYDAKQARKRAILKSLRNK